MNWHWNWTAWKWKQISWPTYKFIKKKKEANAVFISTKICLCLDYYCYFFKKIVFWATSISPFFWCNHSFPLDRRATLMMRNQLKLFLEVEWLGLSNTTFCFCLLVLPFLERLNHISSPWFRGCSNHYINLFVIFQKHFIIIIIFFLKLALILFNRWQNLRIL